MPPSVVIEEENPVNTVPRIMSPQAPGRIVGTAPYVVGAPQFGVAPEASAVGAQPWGWQFLPSELIYKSYLAGPRESRLGAQWVLEKHGNWLWDATLGGHVGLLRYGNDSPVLPEGWQLDAEGAAFPRLSLDAERELVSADFRFGFPLTWRRGPLESKFGYYHISSHLGDEFLIDHQGDPDFHRRNYVRDSLVWGVALRPHEAIRLYAEADWAFHEDGGTKPWEFQFGLDLSRPQPSGRLFDPFFAINSRLREEVDYSGNLTVQAGLQWHGQGGHLLRVGAQYFNGLSEQGQFLRRFEEQIGLGVWYDF